MRRLNSFSGKPENHGDRTLDTPRLSGFSGRPENLARRKEPAWKLTIARRTIPIQGRCATRNSNSAVWMSTAVSAECAATIRFCHRFVSVPEPIPSLASRCASCAWLAPGYISGWQPRCNHAAYGRTSNTLTEPTDTVVLSWGRKVERVQHAAAILVVHPGVVRVEARGEATNPVVGNYGPADGGDVPMLPEDAPPATLKRMSSSVLANSMAMDVQSVHGA